jgi:hypothetical protein
VKKPEVDRDVLDEERESTQAHCTMVGDIMKCVANIVVARGKVHDKSKFSDEELPYFAQATNLKKLPYGSKQYNDQLSIGSVLRPALDHHYANNRHHPEYHEDGIPGMNLVDLVEMMSDWLAAGMRHGPGHNIFNSINVNRMRFKIPRGMARIMWNTAIDIFGEEPEEGYEMVVIAECNKCGEWQDPQNPKCAKCDCDDLRIV